MIKEEYRPILGYEGRYEIWNLGNVKSLKRKHVPNDRILSPSLSSQGYLFVILSKDKECKPKYVHKLVAIAFLNHTPCGYNIVCNHKNFIKTDNSVDNLELVTPRENTNHKHLKSSSKYTGVCWNKNLKKWKATIYINKKNIHLGYYKTELEASNAYQKELIKLKTQVA